MNFMETVNQQCITTTINQNRHGTAILLLEHAHPVRERTPDGTIPCNCRTQSSAIRRLCRDRRRTLRLLIGKTNLAWAVDLGQGMVTWCTPENRSEDVHVDL